MKKLILLSIFLVLAATACQPGPTACMAEKIEAFKQSGPCTDGRAINTYKFNGEVVYVFDPGYCLADGGSEVVNQDCQTLGYLGGIMGNRTIQGKNFDEAKHLALIWKN